jgi:preprotein translocase subunit SecB
MEVSKLQLVNYQVQELRINRNNDFDYSKESVEIKTKIEKKISKIDNDKVLVSLRVIVPESKEIPFSAYVEIMGVFSLNKWESKDNAPLIKSNACVILFPFLRAALSNLTNLAGFPPYILPIYDLGKDMEEAKKDIEKTETKEIYK